MSQSVAASAGFPQSESSTASIAPARVFCAVLSLADAAAMGLMFLAPRAFSSGVWFAIYLALLIVTGAFFGVLAVHPGANERPRVFVNLAMMAALIQAVFLIPFVLDSGSAPAGLGLTWFRAALLALTLISLLVFALATDRGAAHRFLLQTAHRTICIGVLAGVVKIGLSCWGRAFPWAVHLVPAAFILFAIAAATSRLVHQTSRDQAGARAESVGLFWASAAFLALTIFFLPELASAITAQAMHLLRVMHIN